MKSVIILHIVSLTLDPIGLHTTNFFLLNKWDQDSAKSFLKIFSEQQIYLGKQYVKFYLITFLQKHGHFRVFWC